MTTVDLVEVDDKMTVYIDGNAVVSFSKCLECGKWRNTDTDIVFCKSCQKYVCNKCIDNHS